MTAIIVAVIAIGVIVVYITQRQKDDGLRIDRELRKVEVSCQRVSKISSPSRPQLYK